MDGSSSTCLSVMVSKRILICSPLAMLPASILDWMSGPAVRFSRWQFSTSASSAATSSWSVP
jgi:hypothetical protein